MNGRIEIRVNQLGVLQDNALYYIGRDCSSIPSILCEQHGDQVERIDLSFNCLRTLSGLERFKDLVEVILDNNELDDSITIPYLPKLKTFSINKNKIKDLDFFLEKVANFLPALNYLSLLGNTACPNQLSSKDKDEEDYQKYRLFVINRLPRLKFLDSTPVTPKEKREALRVGALMRIARPVISVCKEAYEVDNEDNKNNDNRNFTKYTPLPTSHSDGKHKGAYGVCRYKYLGLHSEGNRFIRNSDL